MSGAATAFSLITNVGLGLVAALGGKITKWKVSDGVNILSGG